MIVGDTVLRFIVSAPHLLVDLLGVPTCDQTSRVSPSLRAARIGFLFVSPEDFHTFRSFGSAVLLHDHISLLLFPKNCPGLLSSSDQRNAANCYLPRI